MENQQKEKNQALLKNALNIQKIPDRGDKLSKSAAEKIQSLKKKQRPFTFKNGILKYTAKNGQENLNLNKKAKDQAGESIVCRHLADYVLKNNIKQVHHTLTNVETISNIKSLRENEVDQTEDLFNPTHCAILDFDQTGEYLYEIAKLLQPGEQCNLSIFSNNHVMALNIQHKKGTTLNPYVIKFYDPNQTSTHLRLVCDNTQVIKSLSMNDFLSPVAIQSYFENSQTVAVLSSNNAKLKNAPPHTIVKSKNFADSLRFGIIFSLIDVVKSILEIIFSAIKNTEQLFESLQATNNSKDIPNLFIAMQKGDQANMVVYLKAILTAEQLNVKQKVELLTAVSPKGTSGFLAAIENKKSEIARLYLNTIFKAGNNSVSYQLLQVLLINVINKDHPHLIKYLLKCGADINLKDENGHTPLQHAILNKKPESIKILLANDAETDIEKKSASQDLKQAIKTGSPKAVLQILDLSDMKFSTRVRYGDEKTRLQYAKIIIALGKYIDERINEPNYNSKIYTFFSKQVKAFEPEQFSGPEKIKVANKVIDTLIAVMKGEQLPAFDKQDIKSLQDGRLGKICKDILPMVTQKPSLMDSLASSLKFG